MTLGLAAVVGGTRAAKADLPSAPGDVPQSALAPTDYSIVRYLHSLSLLAISLGETAEKNGGTKAVRDFGATLVSDHTAGDQQLLAYAKNAGIDPNQMKNQPPPAEMKSYFQSVNRLKTLTGQEFDREFTATVRDGYARVISVVQHAQPNVADPKLSALLTKRMPILERNYQTASTLAAAALAPSSSERQPAPNTTSTGQTQEPAPAKTP